mmetsp:Transcript_5214/g.13150  ORF Transcript_5214/g.13150 Transcript_5214/m.13150 type:complete len:116 (+) Transcript_5214:249-596(+)
MFKVLITQNSPCTPSLNDDTYTTHVTRSLLSKNTQIERNNLLRKIDLPSLLVANIFINENENLEKISLPEFTGGDIFIIDDNPKLKKLCASKFDGGGGGFCEVQSPFSMACTGLS